MLESFQFQVMKLICPYVLQTFDNRTDLADASSNTVALMMGMEKLSKHHGRAMQQFKLERLIRLAKAYTDGNTTALMGMEEISRQQDSWVSVILPREQGIQVANTMVHKQGGGDCQGGQAARGLHQQVHHHPH